VSRPYPIHEAKAKLSEILRQVKQGRSVTISERGRDIARVVPVERPTDLVGRLEQLERDGFILRRAGRIDAIRPLIRRPGALKRFLGSRG